MGKSGWVEILDLRNFHWLDRDGTVMTSQKYAHHLTIFLREKFSGEYKLRLNAEFLH